MKRSINSYSIFNWVRNHQQKIILASFFAMTTAFFALNILLVWDLAIPFCKADDWRTIRIYLDPFFMGNLTLLDYWNDPSHPTPLYTLTMLWNAKFFGLRADYTLRIYLIFQFFIGIIFTLHWFTQVKELDVKRKLLSVPIFSILILTFFSLNIGTQYSWDRVTEGYLYLFILTGFTFLISKDLQSVKSNWIVLSAALVIYTLFCLAYIELMAVFSVTFLVLLTYTSITYKGKRTTSIILLISIFLITILSRTFVSSLTTAHLGGKADIGLILQIIQHPVLLAKSFGIGLLSGVIDFSSLLKAYPKTQPIIEYTALGFTLTFAFVLVCELLKKKRSNLFALTLMFFGLCYTIPVLLFRTNPLENTAFCLVIHRYGIYYQLVLVGFFISFFQNLVSIKRLFIPTSITIFAVSLMIFLWIAGSKVIIRKANFLSSKYPEVAVSMRLKIEDESITLPSWIAAKHHGDLKEEFELLKKYQLSVFNKEFPY